MAKTRGTTLIPRIKYVRGKGAWDEVFPRLEPETRAIVARTVLASSWYPFASLADLIRTADKVMGAGDLAIAREMGRYSATANLSTVFRLLIRFTTPTTILAKGAALWSLNHDSGRVEARPDGTNAALYVIHDHGEPDLAFCASLAGWIERCLEMTGAKTVVVNEEACAAREGSVCRFRATWTG
jgi:hypothetical protein